MAPRVIVVGGGLSGLSAAHTIYLAGGNVVVLDKQGLDFLSLRCGVCVSSRG
jgi:flavin-dependent dehydrogenase